MCMKNFYDARYEHTNYGQFVAKYNKETLINHKQDVGLNLMGGVPTWAISGQVMNHVVKWLNEI